MTPEERTELRRERKRLMLEHTLSILKKRLERIKWLGRGHSLEENADWIELIDLCERRISSLETRVDDEQLDDILFSFDKASLREWRRRWRLLKRRIRADKTHWLRSFLFASENSSPDVPAKTLPPLERIFPESDMLQAFGRALLQLGVDASPEHVCVWVDNLKRPPDLIESYITSENDHSFAKAYNTNDRARHSIQTQLGKVRNRMRAEGYFPQVM